MFVNIAILYYYVTLTVLQNCYFKTAKLDITVAQAYSHIKNLLKPGIFKAYMASSVYVVLLVLSATQWRRSHFIL